MSTLAPPPDYSRFIEAKSQLGGSFGFEPVCSTAIAPWCTRGTMERAERVRQHPSGPDHQHPRVNEGTSMAAIQSTVTYKDIPGFPHYRIGDDGSVWSRKAKGGNARAAGRLRLDWVRLSLFPCSSGHLQVNLFHDGKGYILAVHRLVLEAFVGPCPEGMEGCHYPDSDPTNNHLANLRWDTQAENAKDRYRDRLTEPTRVCTRCQQTRLVAEMSKNNRRPDGLGSECKRCASTRTAECNRKRRAKAR